MLVGITMGMPRQVRKLPAIAAKIETDTNAQKGTVRASIHYFRKTVNGKEVDGLHTLKTFQSSWKKALHHYARYPYTADTRILPVSLAEQFNIENSDYESKEAQVRLAWVEDEYPEWKESAPERMGTNYDPSDFPSAEECMKRFVCKVTVDPLAAADQWNRITMLSPNIAATMQQRQDENMALVIKDAHAKLWSDVMRPLQNMVEVLSKDKTKIHETLLGNIISVCDLIPAYNDIHQDSNLSAVAASVKEKLSAISVEDLRSSAESKAAALEAAKSLVEEFSPYARALSDDDED